MQVFKKVKSKLVIHSSLLFQSVFIKETNPRPLGSSGTLFILLFAKMSFNVQNACVHQMFPEKLIFCNVNVILACWATFIIALDKVMLAYAAREVECEG